MKSRSAWRVAWELYRSPRALADALVKGCHILRRHGLGGLRSVVTRKVARPTLPVAYLLGHGNQEAAFGGTRSSVAADVPQRAFRSSVTVIVLTKGKQDLLNLCLKSLAMSIPPAARVDIVVVNNGPAIAPPPQFPFRVRIKAERQPFNWSAYNNSAATESNAEHLLLLNDDVTALDPGWLNRMLAVSMTSHAGPVGALLLYPDGSIQHAGIAVGSDGLPFHRDKLMPLSDFLARYGTDPFDAFAVTGACLLVRRGLFNELGGLDTRFAFSYNDVDFCRRAVKARCTPVVVPSARLIHMESHTRPLKVDAHERSLYLQLYPPNSVNIQHDSPARPTGPGS